MKIKLTHEERQELKKHHRQIMERRLADRIKAILLLDSGYTIEEISSILLFDEKTIRRYKKKFLKGGVDLLMDLLYKGASPKLTFDQINELIEHLNKNLYASAKEIVHFIKQKFNINYTPEGLVILLHRLGFSYKKTRPIPAKADKEKQESFLEEYFELRENLAEDEGLFFMDAFHPTHNVMPAYAWIKKGTDKPVKSNTGRQRININGVYSPINHEIIVREDDRINSDSVINSFKMIEERHPKLKKIYLIADNARYYYSKKVRDYLEKSKIELVYLPAYSPNLNLIERLWKFFKKKVISNKYYEKFKDFKNATFDFFENKIHRMKNELSSLMTEKFQIIDST